MEIIASEADYFQYRLLDSHVFKHLGDDSAIDQHGNVIRAPADDGGESFGAIKGSRFSLHVFVHGDKENQYWMAAVTDGVTNLVLNCGKIFDGKKT